MALVDDRNHIICMMMPGGILTKDDSQSFKDYTYMTGERMSTVLLFDICLLGWLASRSAKWKCNILELGGMNHQGQAEPDAA